ncbi:hypothetical protein H9L39_15237, partial [Fusarium oxysporum f. sp. albedinis]
KAIKLARRVNQYGSQVKAKYPKQFGFFASLPLPDIKASLKEIDYLFKQLSPKPDGIVMMSNYYGLYLGDRDLEPIYDALNELNHPTTPCTQFNKLRFDIDKTAPSISQQQWQALNRPVAVRQFAAPTLDFPFETTRTFADLFYTSMPTKFPNLKWIMSHAGGEDSMKQTLSESFYFDLAGPWPVNYAIPALLRWVDYTRIVWGSDIVFTPMSSAAKYAAAFDKDVEEVFPDPRKANAIRATNARVSLNPKLICQAVRANPEPRLNPKQLTAFLAANSTGVGVLVCPGGGYSVMSISYEGFGPAEYLNTLGIDAWVLNYTTASIKTPPLYPTPMDEALAAVELIRKQSPGTKKLGVMGFSAGGHLAGTTLTTPKAKLDFGILSYPVITMEDDYTHENSRYNLLGNNPTRKQIESLSVQNRVSDKTPPTFLFHTSNDELVPVQNTYLYANAMAKHGRKVQVVVLPDGKHGIGLGVDDPVRDWRLELERFLKYSI